MGGGINQTESKDMKGKDYELYIYMDIDIYI